MPASPTGGISIFINIAILIIGSLFKYINRKVKNGSRRSPNILYQLITDKKYDGRIRKAFGYGIAIVMFSIVSVTTTISIYNRLTNESNYDLIAPKVSKLFRKMEVNIMNTLPNNLTIAKN